MQPTNAQELPENLTEEQEMYKENIIDHYKNPRNKKELENPTVKHRELNPLCGDTITIYLIIEENKLKEVAFTGDGCAISQASISLLTEKIKDMSIEEIKKLTKNDVFELLGIPISHTRLKCALLSLKTIQKGLEEEGL